MSKAGTAEQSETASSIYANAQGKPTGAARVWQHIVAALFCTFFTCVCLNPSVHGLTVYLSWFIPFFDPQVYRWVVRKGREIDFRQYAFAFALFGLFFIVTVLVGQALVPLRVMLLALTLVYLVYLKSQKLLFWLYVLVDLNIVVAVMQFATYYLYGEEAAKGVGATAISQLVWGSHATLTNTNFIPIMGEFIRVPALSREAGFFATLVAVTALLYWYEKGRKVNAVQIIVFLVGLFVSFSKSALFLIVCIPILLLRKHLNRVPYWVVLVVWAMGSVLLALYLQSHGYFSIPNESITHRLGSPYFLRYFSPLQLAFGAGGLGPAVPYDSMAAWLVSNGLEPCGIAGLVELVGIVGGVLYFECLRQAGLKSSGLLLLLFFTATTNVFTATSFVVLAYFLALQMSYEKE